MGQVVAKLKYATKEKLREIPEKKPTSEKYKRQNREGEYDYKGRKYECDGEEYESFYRCSLGDLKSLISGEISIAELQRRSGMSGKELRDHLRSRSVKKLITSLVHEGNDKKNEDNEKKKAYFESFLKALSNIPDGAAEVMEIDGSEYFCIRGIDGVPHLLFIDVDGTLTPQPGIMRDSLFNTSFDEYYSCNKGAIEVLSKLLEFLNLKRFSVCTRNHKEKVSALFGLIGVELLPSSLFRDKIGMTTAKDEVLKQAHAKVSKFCENARIILIDDDENFKAEYVWAIKVPVFTWVLLDQLLLLLLEQQ